MKSMPKIGLALSGGGVRGLAHLGVLDVLQNASVPVRYIAGTSMGGIIAGLYASGIPIEDIIAFCEEIGIMSLASLENNWRGIFGHEKMQKYLADFLGNKDITFEDLKVPVAVVATDIETGEMVVLDKGPLIPALLATSAFPIVFAPVYHQGRWLVDGGVLNNFPVDIVRHMGADRVLGVITPPGVKLGLETEEERQERVKQQRLLNARNLFSRNISAPDWRQPFLIAETSVGYSISIINETRMVLSPPDLILRVYMPNMGTFDSNKNGEIIEAGRKVALAHLTEIRKLRTAPLPPHWQRRLSSFISRAIRAWYMFREPEYPLYPPV